MPCRPANTWHARGTVHCTLNPRVSSFIHLPECLEYSSPWVPTVHWVVAPLAFIVAALIVVVVLWSDPPLWLYPLLAPLVSAPLALAPPSLASLATPVLLPLALSV